ncbi:MAG: HlyD family efflux transporter periplasmic adaptor subunit [Pseudomonadota bacterium]|nr:HlyD family efflux transporter periplasmic adaptor subunit [Pseudomonadota bacterium]
MFQDDNVSTVETKKNIPLKTEIIFPQQNRPEFLFFRRIIGKNEISMVSRLGGKITYVSDKLFNAKKVEINEILFTIDAFEFEQDLIRKKAYLEELKIELDKTSLLFLESKKQLKIAEEDYERKRKLFGNTVSKKALDDSALKVSELKAQSSRNEFQINAIKVNIKEAKANLKVAKKNLSFTNYKAPFVGKVTDNKIDLGSEIKAGDHLAKLINTSELEVKFFVGEGKLTELGTNNDLYGKNLTLRWKKSKFKEFYNAELTRIDSVVDEATAGLNMYAKIKDITAEDPIRPGVFVEVLLQGKPIQNTIIMPENAVYEEKYIYLLKDSKPIKLNVKVEGYKDNNIILSGDFVSGSMVILTRLDSFQSNDFYYSVPK